MINAYLLFAMLLVSFAHLKCGADKDWKPAVRNYTHSERMLQEGLSRSKNLRPIRILFQHTTNSWGGDSFGEDQKTHFYNKVVPTVKHWFSSVLSVYSITEPIIVPSSMKECNGAAIPSSHHSPGVSSADFIVYVYGYHRNAHYGSKSCLYETGGRYNELAGSYSIDMTKFFNLTLSEQITDVIHHLTHLMVFSPYLFERFVKPDGNFYNSKTEIKIQVYHPKRDKYVYLLALPTVVAQNQKIFGCSSVIGAELEDNEDSLSIGSHWDFKVVKEDIMVAEPPLNPVVSGLTLALFQDSGWYWVNWNKAQPMIWGVNQGCSWLTEKCINNTIPQQGMCTDKTYVGCDVYNVAPAYCNITRVWSSSSSWSNPYKYFSDPTLGCVNRYSDYCPVLTPSSAGDCRDPLTKANETLGEAVGPGSRCLTSTLFQNSYYFTGELRAVCHKVKSCENDHAVLEIAGNEVICPFTGGDVAVPGFNGFLNCPKSNILCSPAPCRNSCYARGMCKSGICMCDPGYGGIDCELVCADNCKACDSETDCNECYSTASLVDRTCTCPEDSTWDAQQKICQPGSIIGCDVSCKGCETATTCADCWPSATLANGFCNCQSRYEFNSTVMTCTPVICPEECYDCAVSNICSRCYESQKLINGRCLCPSGKVFDVDTKTCEIKGCPSNCRGCATVSTCSKCYSTAKLTADGKCVCPSGTIYQEATKTCDFTTCPPSCNGCATAKMCLACYSTATMVNGQCLCPIGTSFELVSRTCKADGVTSCDPLCSECASTTKCKTCYSTGILTSDGKCACPTGSSADFVSKTCVQGCTPGCKTCSGVGDFRCLSCFPGYYLLYSTCVRACPTGYGQTTTGCAPINLSIYNAAFQQWNNTYYSSTSSIPIFFGSTSQFMPTPEDDDPILVYSRGLYFTGSSLSLLPPNNKVSSRLSLSPSHVVEMWIRPDDSAQTQSLLQKYADESLIELSITNSKLRLASLFLNITSLNWHSNMTEGPAVNSKQWQWISYSIMYDPSIQSSIVTLFVNSAKESKLYSGLIFFDVDVVIYKESFSIGSKFSLSEYTSGYKGFIAKIIITNQAYTPAYSSSQCIGDFCLANCEFFQYADSTGSCGNCLMACSYSCAQAHTCILNTDPMCISPISFTSCEACIAGASVKEGKCACMKNSYFDSATNSCVCNSNSTLINGYCTTCGNYYAGNEVKAYFSENFKSVIIEFARAAKSGLASDCSEIFYQRGLVKLGKDPICVWQGYNQIQVFLGLHWTLAEEELAINPFSVQARGSDCSLNIEDLKPIVKYQYTKPAPLAIITAPNTYSFGCNKNDLIISGDNSLGSNLRYSWSATSFPSNEALVKYISSITDSKFKIPISNLAVSFITISLTVTNQLNQTNTASYIITVKNEYSLDVFIDSGGSSSILASQNIKYKALISSLCVNSTSLSIFWDYVSSSADSFDPSQILANSKSYILKIEKNQLKGGNWYLFNATASDGYSYGWSTLNITVRHSDLILKLNRADGTASSDIDLYMSASESYDPDDLNTPLSYNWTCSENNSPCLDSSGLKLLGDEAHSSLVVSKSKLKIYSEYIFTLAISKDIRVTRKSISIKIVQPSGSSLSISFKEFKVNPQYAYKFTAKVETSRQPNFLWAQVSGPSLTQISSLTKGYIKFAAYSMQEGASYSFSLTMSFSNSLTLIASVPWITNKGPTCDGIDISQNADLTYTLMGLNCIDGDDQDYPLSYMYGTIINNKQYYLNTQTTSSSFTLGITTGIWKMAVKVCDSMWTCTSYSETITVESRRLLSDVPLEDQYRASIINPDMIPSSIIMYSADLSNNKTLSYMFSDLSSFIASQGPIDEGMLDTYIGCLSSMMMQKKIRTQGFLNQTFQILNKTLMAYTDKITDSQAEAIIDMISPYYTNVADFSLLLNLFQYLANSWMNDTLPGDVKEYSNGVYFSNIRNIGQDFLNTTYELGNLTTNILPSAEFRNETVYDLCLTVYPNAGNYSDIIDISIYKSGSYQNYSLELVSPSIELFPSGLNLIANSTTFAPSPYETWGCYMLSKGKWEPGKCSIISIKKNKVSIQTQSAGTFQILKAISITPNPPPPKKDSDSSNAGTENAPRFAMGVIMLAGVLLSVIFALLDRRNIEESTRPSILESYLLTSLFIPQRSSVRVINVVHMETVLLSELASIGVMHYRNNPTSGSDGNFADHASNYSFENLENMAAGLLIGQLISLILWGLKSRFNKSILFKAVFLVACGILSWTSIVATIIMAAKYSAEASTQWFLEFIIVIPIDFFIFQSSFSIIRYCLRKKKISLQPQDAPDVSVEENSQVPPCTPENELTSFQ